MEKAMKKVLFLTNIPSPYMVKFFNLLSESTELIVIYERKVSIERGKRWNDLLINHNSIFLKGINVFKSFSFAPQVIFRLFGKYDVIIISNPISPTGSLAIMFLKLIKKEYWLFSEGGFVKKEHFLLSKIKKIILKDARRYLSGCKNGDEYFLNYGAKESGIFRTPFSSVNESQILRIRFSKNSKKALLGKKNVIAVGRFIPLKNFKWLIEEWSSVIKDYHLYIVGEGPLYSEYCDLINLNSSYNIHLIDYMNHEALLEYMSNFDLLVHPTLTDVWGLIVNEAFSQGLPVVTTPNCLAGLEMVSIGENGYIEEPNRKFILRVESLLNDDQLLKNMRLNNLKKIKSYTIESMVISIKSMID